MTDEDWDRLHAKVFGTIGAYERRRRTRTLLIAAAVLVVALIALAATWQLTRPSANSRAGFTVACASDATSAANVLVVTSNGDPRALCEAEWAKGAVAPDQTTPPSALLPCARLLGDQAYVVVVPSTDAGTCSALGYADVPPAYAADAPRFERVQTALMELPSGRSRACRSRAPGTRRAQRSTDAGLGDWEVARDGSFDGDGSCRSWWSSTTTSGSCSSSGRPDAAGDRFLTARSELRREPGCRCATWGVRRPANPSGEEVGTRSSRLRRRAYLGARAAGVPGCRSCSHITEEPESCDSALALLVICSATALAVVPAAAGDEPGTLETLPAAQADDRLAELGVPSGDIPEAVEILDEARSDPEAEIVGDSVVWEDGAVELDFVSPMSLASCLSGRTCLWENASYGGAMLSFTATLTVIDLAAYGGSTAHRRGPTSGPPTRSSDAGPRQQLGRGEQAVLAGELPGRLDGRLGQRRGPGPPGDQQRHLLIAFLH